MLRTKTQEKEDLLASFIWLTVVYQSKTQFCRLWNFVLRFLYVMISQTISGVLPQLFITGHAFRCIGSSDGRCV